MSQRDWVTSLVETIVGDRTKAEMVVTVLIKEGVLHVGHGDKDVDAIVDAFMELFGTTKTSDKDRFAASRLANKYDARAVIGIMRILAEHATDSYAPVVNSVSQLEEKFVSVLSYARKTQQDNVIEI